MRRRCIIKPPISITSTITINQSITNPDKMVTGDINGECIKWIRQNSHIYLCKYKNNMMHICQLDDSNSDYYHDGTLAALNSIGVDVMMKLPVFYTKTENLASDVWNISFSTAKKSGWTQWGGDLIGVYEGFVNANKLYSVTMSGSSSTGDRTYSQFKTYAKNRGNGFSMVKWKHQNIMAFLYYAMYGNTDCTSTIGNGGGGYGRELGLMNYLGMTDTSDNSRDSMKFWGLENWWGGKSEWVDNVIINPDQINNVWRITEDDGSTRDVQGKYVNGPIGRIVIGPYLDVIGLISYNSTSTTIGYCDTQYVSNDLLKCRGWRSGSGVSWECGVAYFRCENVSSFKNAEITSRLAYSGPITEMKDVQEFKLL